MDGPTKTHLHVFQMFFFQHMNLTLSIKEIRPTMKSRAINNFQQDPCPAGLNLVSTPERSSGLAKPSAKVSRTSWRPVRSRISMPTVV